jgi:hypothetical protein
MPSNDGTSTIEAVHNIKQEIDRLTEIQTNALKIATFGGMTSEEAQDYDNRRTQILNLVHRLETLEKSL